MYKYETHLHTYPVSKCARSTVRENLELYKEFGYDGVFITNHFLDGNITTYKCSNCERTYEIEYSMGSTGIDYNNIIDIRKNDEESLFIGGNR